MLHRQRTRNALIGSLLPLALCMIVYRLWDGVCPIRQMLGIPCPGCGMTRAVVCLLRLDVVGAFAYHPLWWTLPFVGVILLRALFPGAFRRILDRIGCGEAQYLRVEAYLVVLLLLLFFGVYAVRLFSGWRG